MKTLINSLVVAGLVASSANAIDAKYVQSDSVMSKLNISKVVDIRNMFKFNAPDLTVSLSSYSEGNFLAGQLFPEITYEVQSRMGAINQALSVSIFVTKNPKQQLIHKEIYRSYINLNGENSEFTTDMTMHLPENLVAGIYYIGVEIDDSTGYEEINEHNNVAYYKITIVDPYVTLEQFGRSGTTSSSTHWEGQEQSCKDAYGPFSRVADWKDLENLEKSGGNINEFVQEILFGDRSEKLFINVDGDAEGSYRNKNGKYIIQKGNQFMKTLGTIDTIGKNKVDLRFLGSNDDTFQETLCYIPLIMPAFDSGFSVDSDIEIIIKK